MISSCNSGKIFFNKIINADKLTFFVYAVVFIYFAQVSGIISNFDSLMIREVDDYIYHLSLRRMHENMLHLDLIKLLNNNDWGYGWFFWITYALLTFPFFIIFHLFGYEQPVVIASRIINMLFTLGGVYYFNQIGKLFKISQLNRFLINLLPLSFAGLVWLGFFRFGTASMGMFFATMLFYFLLKEEKYSKSYLLKIAALFVLAIATKLSNLVMLAPFVSLMIWKSFEFKINKEVIKTGIVFGAVLVCSSILLYNPYIFFNFKPFMHELSEFAHLAERNYEKFSVYKRIIFITTAFYLNLPCTIFVFGVGAYLMYKKPPQYNLLLIVGASILSVYIIVTVKYPTVGYNYIFSIFYLLLILILIVAKNIQYSGLFIALILVVNILYPSKVAPSSATGFIKEIYTYHSDNYQNSLASKKAEICDILYKTIDNNPKTNIIIGVTFSAPACYSMLSKNNNVAVNYLSYDYPSFFVRNVRNMEVLSSYRYILSRVLPGLVTEKLPNEIPKNEVYYDYLILSKKPDGDLITKLKEQKVINGKTYHIIEDNDKYIILMST